ncbi:MaoC/PaaZ C-terminal domain-containing protein [Bacillus sinesaloumensis]|uniref:MaoC/PaaZ C-terminal domain-containing protein n=1 Tax=Litchfieldia sinesaloumensis TaxID=1926280 RepID=UPI00098862C0|nr:MaoC/PaaZ C-terminal domain-containing protein [Bacillus sinesaloumensis]
MNSIVKMESGSSLQSVQLPPVSRMDLIKYSGASGDYNPIHTIDEEAHIAGLPGVIAHGMWTMGNLAKLFTPYHEEGFIKTYSIRFRNMVFLNDVITLNASLKEIYENKRIFDVVAVNQHEKAVIKGTIVFQVYE